MNPKPPQSDSEIRAKEEAKLTDEYQKRRNEESQIKELKFAEEHASDADGLIGRLLVRVNGGMIKTSAFKRAMKIWKDDSKHTPEYIELLKPLASPSGLKYMGGGDNFDVIADAFESGSKAIRELARNFLKKGKNAKDEQEFLVKLKILRKEEEDNPELIAKQVRGKADLNGSKGKKAAMEIIDRRENLGILPEFPEIKEECERMRVSLEEGNERLAQVGEEVEKSQLLADSKKSLELKLREDPEYVSRHLERMMEDAELLQEVIRVQENPDLQRAYEAFAAQRANYSGENATVLNNEETLHLKFLRSGEGREAKKTLVAALSKSSDALLKTALELEVEREIDGEFMDDDKAEISHVEESDLSSALTRVVQKYELKGVKVDPKFVTLLKQRVDHYLEHRTKDAEVRKKFRDAKLDAIRWNGRNMSRIQKGLMAQEDIGARLFDTNNNLPIYPRAGSKFCYDVVIGGEPMTKVATITGIRYVPVFAPDDVEGKEIAEQKFQSSKGVAHPEVLVTEYEVDGRMHEWKGNFFDWVTINRARPVVNSDESEKFLSETTDLRMEIRPGAVYIQECGEEKGVPRFYFYEIDRIEGTKVIFKNPILYRTKEERYEDIRTEMEIGEFQELVLRRNLKQANASGTPATTESYTTTVSNPFNPEESTELYVESDGTFADLYEQFGPAMFVNPPTEGGLQAIMQLPFSKEEGKYNGIKFTRGHQPAVSHVESVDKLTIEKQHEAENAIFGGKVPVEHERKYKGFEETGGEGDIGKRKKQAEHAEPHLHEGAHGGHGGGHGGHGGGHGEAYGLSGPEEGNPAERNDVIPEWATGAKATAERPKVSYAHSVWKETYFLSTEEFIGLGKAIYEHWQRRWSRRSKEKFASVGQGLPFSYGPEMSRAKQMAENEEVHQNEEAMEHWGIDQINEALHESKNKDQLKACMLVLSKKGHIRWDDIHMWQALNRWVPEGLMIPIPANHNPWSVDPRTGKTGLDYLESAIDFLWGQSTYVEWFEQNNSNYDHKLKQFEAQGKQLEGDPKGTKSVDGELQRLLTKHKHGEYVDPHQFEGLLHFIINAGKGRGPETKLYYIVEAVAVPNPLTGETLLSLDRLGSMNGEFLNRFPLLDYLCRRDVPTGEYKPDGSPITRSWTLADFQAWVKYWDEGITDPEEVNRPSRRCKEHLWNYALTDEKTIIRNNKGLRNAQDMDHDDAHIIIPLADEQIVQEACRSVAGGGQRYFTQEGYANAYVGFSQYVKTLGGRADKPKLVKAIRSFVRFDSIMDERYRKDQDSLARLGDSMWDRGSVVDDWSVRSHQQQMHKLIKEIAYAYKNDELIGIVDTMFKKTRSLKDKNEAAKQDVIQQSLDNFGKLFQQIVGSDDGQKMLSVIQGTELRGLAFEMTVQQQKARFAEAEARADKLSNTFINR